MDHPTKDITIIGAGPAGLFALFYAGMRETSAQIVDALQEPGGQLTALYPEKYIFDVAGYPQVLAKDLVKALREQASRFREPIHLGHAITGLEEADGHFVLRTERDRFPTKSIIIAAGIGAFSPRRLPQPCATPWYGRGIYDVVTDPQDYKGQRVVIVGGGDSAFDWATQLRGVAEHVSLVHRSDKFRAHGATVTQFEEDVKAGRASMFTFHELADVLCKPVGERFTHLILKQVKTKETTEIEADVVLPMLGFVSDIGPLADWGLTLQKHEIVVNQLMETGRAGIWAAGDVTAYPGKLKLIACGFGEAATAVNQAVHWMYPEKKVAPGHSSNMGVFGQKDD
ncbi:MAG: NAD(P)/FAD-dependent oxidoreductase [Gemmatimonadaceae bacterium]|nr:NAD(P)/FAD-dependent oxidoreductase [Gemmatimonadaceae bacterium]NUP54914.1 NAD(P)/FAD-dependent oxidoreductase [Gemmatimonadaceae bacterium]NUP70323.1 NAD(P)/FAD-dependent oxidoreductase [Gemmatimonadaceae bacterium]